jgi:hypothetical protein
LNALLLRSMPAMWPEVPLLGLGMQEATPDAAHQAGADRPGAYIVRAGPRAVGLRSHARPLIRPAVARGRDRFSR